LADQSAAAFPILDPLWVRLIPGSRHPYE